MPDSSLRLDIHLEEPKIELNSFERELVARGQYVMVVKSVKARDYRVKLFHIMPLIRMLKDSIQHKCKTHNILPQVGNLYGWMCDKCGTKFLEQ